MRKITLSVILRCRCVKNNKLNLQLFFMREMISLEIRQRIGLPLIAVWCLQSPAEHSRDYFLCAGR